MKKSGNFSRILVTSALTYANGYTHLGHIAGSILPADMFVRYCRLAGYDVIYVCGSDEYGTAIEMSAIKEDIPPKEIIDKYHFSNKKAYEDLGMSFDIYSRTSTDIHKQTSQEFFTNLFNKGLLYKKTEKQLYSEKEKRFLADRFVVGTCPVCGYEEAKGDECENCGSSLSPLELINPRSTITGDTPVVKESTHFYFPLSKYQGELEKWIDSKPNWKSNVVNYCKGWFKTGLQDRAITRDLDWGVPVPVEGNDGKVIYVWFEAPIGYISNTKELFEQKGEPEKWKEYWNKDDTKLVHFLGKDNIIFHAIFFPAMLMAHGDFVLADNVPANEFMNLEGSKQSKSRGHAIYVKDIITKLEPDVIRYTIATNLPENRDSEISLKEFENRNNQLAAVLGNFINRTLVFTQKNFDNSIPIFKGNYPDDNKIFDSINHYLNRIEDNYENFHFKDAINETMNIVREANGYFQSSEPWVKVKTDKDRCASIINQCLQACHSLAILINPFIPFTSEKILRMLNIGNEHLKWSNIPKKCLIGGNPLGNSEILFPKLENLNV